MSVTRVNRKQLSELLHQPNTNNIRKAISRGALVETKNGLIELQKTENRKWLENQISNGRKKGLVIDLNFSPDPPNEELDQIRNETPSKNNSSYSVDIELKRARTKLTEEQTKTAQLNREIILGNYLRTAEVVETIKVYLDQTMNIANTNIANEITNIAKEHGIKSAEAIVKIKSRLTDSLNLAIESGRKEALDCVERMRIEQIEKLAKK